MNLFTRVFAGSILFKTLSTFLSILSFWLLSWSVVAQPAAMAMPDLYSAKTAKQVLMQGGNAVDAAVASAFVLAVTFPEAGNLGGGGFLTLFDPKVFKEGGSVAGQTVAPMANISGNATAQNPIQSSMTGKSYFLDYRETAPAAAFRDLYLDVDKAVIPYRSLVGYQASGVPGTVRGLWEVHQRFGRLPWKTLLSDAIGYAEQGFVVSEQVAARASWYQQWIADKSPVSLNFEDYFSGLKAEHTFKQPELAKTLALIAEQGADVFYTGKIAQQIVKQMQQPKSQENKGLITLEDLKAYQAVWREPVEGQWQGRTLVSAPPPSSGGIAILQLLKMKALLHDNIQQAWLKAQGNGVTEQTFKTHLYAELSKRVYADRAFYLGDPDFIQVPMARLISEEYLVSRIKGVLLDDISDTERVQPGKLESPETTHFSIIDNQGMAVSNTYTLNMPFGSGVVIEGAGFLMNDEMDDFSTKPGVANVFGVVGGVANEIAPHKRMLSSMSPTLVLNNGQVEMVVGTPGGSTIITSVFQTLVNVVEEGMNAQQAVDAPRVHHQLFPINQIAYSPELPESTKEALQLMGYNLKQNNYMGDVQLIGYINGRWQAASDYRGQGVAEVFDVD